MNRSLKHRIRDNQRFHKYERLLRKIRLRIFEYEDERKLEKAQRIIARIKADCGPRWEAREKRLADRHAERLWNR